MDIIYSKCYNGVIMVGGFADAFGVAWEAVPAEPTVECIDPQFIFFEPHGRLGGRRSAAPNCDAGARPSPARGSCLPVS